MIGFGRPYNRTYQVANWQFWGYDLDFERSLPTQDWGVLAGWQNSEMLAIPTTIRDGLYTERPE